MELTWSTIGKLLLTGVVTYTIFPAILILRDYMLWRFINFFILNRKLRDQIRTYATRRSIWNSAFAVDTKIKNNEGSTYYQIDGKNVSKEEWGKHIKARDNLSSHMDENRLYINRKNKFLDWLLKHYKQDSINPINDWLNEEIKRMN